MRLHPALLLLVLVPTPARIGFAPGAQQPSPAMRGFSPDRARIQRDWESKFKAIPDPTRAKDYMRRLSARPHHVGSPYQREDVEYMRDLFTQWGWEAKIEEYHVLFPTPKVRRLELVAPTRFVARLDEPALQQDPATALKLEQLPTYNAFSGDGDVEGPLVYVNYGVPADYDELERHGISVKGAIVIARYGGSWRGIKPKVAFEHGAIGCIIYSDPRDDGFTQGDVYPDGPWRPRNGVQRGSVLDMPVAPGDPLTIGVGATRDAPRIDQKDAATIMKIPVLPVSWEDAQPLLAAMRGPVAPPAWRGALPITYRLGGTGPARVRLAVQHDWKLTPVLNVVATMRGSEFPDEWIVRGNHIDGWVNGAEDPIAGMVAELEEARALGELARQGWRPRRTIVYAGWDAEEPGLLGSTEWAEHHATTLTANAVAYINTDGNGRGYLGMGGSHSLERFINEVAREVEDPETRLPVWRRSQAQAIRNGGPVQRREARERGDLRIDALGSGSDFTPFIQHLGIASLNLGFGGEGGGGVYHSIYDTPSWYERFSDGDYVYSRALSQVVGLAVMRLASADIVPLQFTNLAETVRGYVSEIRSLRDEMSQRTADHNRMHDDGVYAATSDPRQPVRVPGRRPEVPHVNFAPLDNAVDALTRSAQSYERALATRTLVLPDAQTLARVNAALRATERTFADPAGLPRRPWFRHLLYAPGLYTGYGVKTLPGVREGVEQEDWAEVARQVERLARAIEGAATHITTITSMLESR